MVFTYTRTSSLERISRKRQIIRYNNDAALHRKAFFSLHETLKYLNINYCSQTSDLFINVNDILVHRYFSARASDC